MTLALPLLLAAVYYVDPQAGNDQNSGTAITAPWKTLARIAAADFPSGDRILLKSGSVFREPLRPHNSGVPGQPIVVDRYGEGPLPRIEAGDLAEDAVLLRNLQHIEVRHLEITNRGTA